MGDQPRNDLAAIQRRKLALYGWMLMAPSLALLSLFAFYPAIATFFGSLFTRGTTRRPSSFAGFENYLDLFADPTFWTVAGNNLIYAGVTIPVSIIFALIMALWANAHIPARSFVRSASFTPTILPMLAAATLWLFFYTPDLGIIDRITGFFGAEPTNWLGQPETALAAVIIVTIWKEAGFFMIFYLAALQTIPQSLREAAAIEGCGRWTFFRRVTLPLIMPTTLFVSVNAVINAFRLVDHVFVMTKGGPDSATMLLLYYIFETGFRFWDTAYAAALTVVLIVILSIAGIGQFFLADRRVHYK